MFTCEASSISSFTPVRRWRCTPTWNNIAILVTPSSDWSKTTQSEHPLTLNQVDPFLHSKICYTSFSQAGSCRLQNGQKIPGTKFWYRPWSLCSLTHFQWWQLFCFQCVPTSSKVMWKNNNSVKNMMGTSTTMDILTTWRWIYYEIEFIFLQIFGKVEGNVK